jgi:hypothetical protein
MVRAVHAVCAVVHAVVATALAAGPARAAPDPAPEMTQPSTPETAGPAAPAAAPSAPFVIAGVEVAPGEKKEIRLQLGESFTGAPVEVPVIVARGREPGPVLCLVAALHGDELNGIEVVRTALEEADPALLKGTLVGVPIANPFGFAAQTRYLPDRRDLNRAFPGRDAGSTASRIAKSLFTGVIRVCTHLIDLHTGSQNRANLPQTRGDLTDARVLDLARWFGAPAIVQSRGRKGTLRHAAAGVSIPAILFEAGETMRFQKQEVRKGLYGVRNVMIGLGMRRAERVNLGPVSVYPRTKWVRADRGGLLELNVALGERVDAGDILGTVSDPLRHERAVLLAPENGRVIGLTLDGKVMPGTAVVNLGLAGPRPEARPQAQVRGRARGGVREEGDED